MSETYDAAIRRGTADLMKAGVDSAAVDARALMIWAADTDAAALLAALRDTVPVEIAQKYNSALEDRASHRPVSHIIGGRIFWGRWIEVTADVLDPRPETEVMIDAAISRAPMRVLDLGVGSGCILATVLAETPCATGVGVDASDAALKVAERNIAALGVAQRAVLIRGNWLAEVEGVFDLVLCNPPYITADEMADLSEDVLRFEPHLALTPGGDGLASYRIIAAELDRILTPGGQAMFEIGPTQASDVVAIFATFGWGAPKILQDFDGRDRCLIFSQGQ